MKIDTPVYFNMLETMPQTYVCFGAIKWSKFSKPYFGRMHHHKYLVFLNFKPDRFVFEPNFCMSKPYEEFLQMKFIFKGKLKMLRKT